MKIHSKSGLAAALVAAITLWTLAGSARAQIFVSDGGQVDEPFTGDVSEYSLTGQVINYNLITGLNNNGYLAATQSDLFILNGSGVSEYTTSGALVNANLITGLNSPFGIAVSGGNLFITSYLDGYISEYTTSGTLVNGNLIPGIAPSAITISGNDMFLINLTGGGGPVLGEYTLGGAAINASLFHVVGGEGMAISGNSLFVTDYGTGNNDGSLIQYNLSGMPGGTTVVSGINQMQDVATAPDGTVYYTHLDPDAHTSGDIGQYPGNPNLFQDDEHPSGIAIATPEPGSFILASLALVSLLADRRRGRRPAA